MKVARLQSIMIFATLAVMLTACSMEASIQSLVDDIKALKSPGTAQGITSGSGQMKKDLTSGTYKVSASIGVVGGTNTVNHSLYSQTSGGYKVYSTVQGALVSQ
ncbi:MAG: hypothetical protein ACXVB1_04930 [Pseudobdellovibrionaceae bacterium]